jgi:hypothetical protein
MVMGEAAGVAAALCAKENISPIALDVQQLRNYLTEQGAIINEP